MFHLRPVHILLLVATGWLADATLPECKCKEDQPDFIKCSIAYANDIFALLQSGERPDIGSLNPYALSKLTFRPNPAIKFTLSDISFFLAPITVTDMKISLIKGEDFELTLTVALLVSDSDFLVHTVINKKFIRAIGQAVVSLGGINYTYKSKFIKKEIGGKLVPQFAPGSSVINVGSTLFGLVGIKCISCELTYEEKLTLKRQFSSGREQMVNTIAAAGRAVIENYGNKILAELVSLQEIPL